MKGNLGGPGGKFFGFRVVNTSQMMNKAIETNTRIILICQSVEVNCYLRVEWKKVLYEE